MIEYFESLGTETYIAITLFLISTLIAYYLYRKAKIKKRMEFSYRETFSLIEGLDSLKLDELEVLWNGEKRKNIFVAEIYLRNTGTISLQKDDFLSPINIKFDSDTEILRAKVSTSSEYSKLEWDSYGNSVEIDMKTIEKKKMTKVEIIYANDKISPCNIDLAILDGNTEQVNLSESVTNTTLKNLLLNSKNIKARIYTFIFMYFGAVMFFVVSAFLDNAQDKMSLVFNILRLLPYLILLFPAYIIFGFVKSLSKIYNEKWTEHMSKSVLKRRNQILQKLSNSRTS